MHTAYPVVNDVTDRLKGASMLDGITAEQIAPIDFQQAVDTAISKFETATGRTMLAVAGTRLFDPPTARGKVLFGADLAAVTSITVDGATQVLNTDFFLGPQTSGQGPNPKPFQWVEFFNFSLSLLWKRRCVAITGPWGYAVSIPDLAFQSMIDLACIEVTSSLEQIKTGAAIRRREGDVDVTYQTHSGLGPFAGTTKAWQDHADAGIKFFTRMESYLG